MLRHASASEAEKIVFIPSHPLPILAFAGVPPLLNDLRLSWTAAEALRMKPGKQDKLWICAYAGVDSAENLELNLLSSTGKLFYSAYPKAYSYIDASLAPFNQGRILRAYILRWV